MIAFLFKNLNSSNLKRASPLCRSAPVFFSNFSLRFFSNSVETLPGNGPRITDLLLHKYNFPPVLASLVASDLSHVQNPEDKADSMLTFFKECGFSNPQLVKIVKHKPRFLSASLEDTIKPKIKLFQDKGFSSDDIARIISGNPQILCLHVENYIIPALSLLKSLLGSYAEVAKVIRKCPWILARNVQTNLMPNVDFFRSFGIPMERILIILRWQPSCLTMNPEIIRKSAVKAKEMGINSDSKNFIYAISAIAMLSNDNWELKLQAFRDLGFSNSDISTMFRKAPAMFGSSVEKIKKVKELLLATRKFNLRSIVNYPKSLESSIENRYIPRLRILKILERKNLIENWPNLSVVSMLPDDKFAEKFIVPYSKELGDLSLMKSSAKKWIKS